MENKIQKNMKETIFNALLRRCKTEKSRTDGVFLEYKFEEIWMSIWIEWIDLKKDPVLIEIEHSEEIKLTKSQREDLIKLAISKRELEPNELMEDYHPKRPI